MRIGWFSYFAVFLGSLLLSFGLTRLVRNTALARGWLSRSPSSRDVHSSPIPRLGGVAIFCSFIAVIGLTALLSRSIRSYIDPLPLLAILLPASLIFLLGLFDDLMAIAPTVKFGAQIVAGVLVFCSGYRVFHLPIFFGTRPLSWIVSLLATVFWVLLVTNAFNLLDGLDGLAAGSALFSILTLMAVSLLHGRVLISLLAMALAGAILGFLRFNFNPATIFLGDCGSLFIGFLLSVLSIAASEKGSTAVVIAIPIVSFGLPILETSISVIRRLLSGQPLFKADRLHIHHKLLERGLSQRQVVVVLYGVSAIFAVLSGFLLYPNGATQLLVLVIVGVVIWLGVQHLNYPEFFEIGRVAHRTIEQKEIIVNNLAIRRASDRLAHVSDVSELYQVLQDTFRTNDFDGFELDIVEGLAQRAAWNQHYRWAKATGPIDSGTAGRNPRWELSLALITHVNTYCGRFLVYCAFGRGGLKVDINLLLEEFRAVLADAVERCSGTLGSEEKIVRRLPAQARRAASTQVQ
jgi:UDP-GlcNAc:undecaprenyl-phosphate/decaprenyl-phosphate GlcNAc-1-phosphate transferase